MSSLINDPMAIVALRRQLFELKDEVAMSLEDWQLIWPFIDNMWVERNASRAKDRQQFNCRIWRNDSDKKSGSGQRNRARRNVEPCGMKMYVERQGEGVVVKRCPGRATDVKYHNHKLYMLDKVKTPSAIMKLAADIMSQGKTPSDAVKDVRSLGIVQALENEAEKDIEPNEKTVPLIDSNRVRNAFKSSQQAETTGTLTQAQRRALMTTTTPIHILPLQPGAGPPLRVSCQCGNVQFYTPYSKPLSLYHCHCLECQKQSASAYGTSALYPADTIFPLPAETQQYISIYQRPAKDGSIMDCHFCKVCGSRLMHRTTDADGHQGSTVSIKGGAIEGLDWSGGSHIWTKRAVVPIPSNAQKWRESPELDTLPLTMSFEAHPNNEDATPASPAPQAEMLSIEKDTTMNENPAINPDLPSFAAAVLPYQ